MAGRRKARKTTRIKKSSEVLKCFFCQTKEVPDYKEYKILEKYVSDRARIIGKDRSGLCSRHQQGLSRAIKRARHLGLLPFSQSI